MRKFLFLSCLLLLLGFCSGCADRNPKLNLKTDHLYVEADDTSFDVSLLAGYVSATDHKGNIYPFTRVDISGDVNVSQCGEYPLTLNLVDEEGSTKETLIVSVVDTKAPEIHLVTEYIKLFKGTTFNSDALENLIFAYDAHEGMITEKMVAEGEVDSKHPGEYPVTYTVSDSSGNTASATVTYIVTNTRDEFLHFIYERTMDFYWGKYFVTDKNGKVLNYDDAIYYNFTNAGTSQFERACGLQKNTDDTANGIMLERRDDGIYLLNESGNRVNNYQNTEFYLLDSNGKLIEYEADVTYEIGDEEPLKVQNEFSMKKVAGKFYVEYFVLPNS